MNARDIGLLKTMSGAERILTLEHMLDTLPSADAILGRSSAVVEGLVRPIVSGQVDRPAPETQINLDRVCFLISPIGQEGSEERKHADVILGQIVEPAIDELGLNLEVVRADHLTQPGMISQQILQHLLGARLVVADLSFHNPNVFYELAIRHATGLPTVLITRLSERIPFDIADLRVVRLDMTDIYSFVPRMEGWRAELTQHARQALQQPDAVITPITLVGGLQPLRRL